MAGEHPDTARLVTGDVVAAVHALRDDPGDELQIWGSSNLLQTLLQHELVDRFRLMTFPLVLGSGRRLFNDGILPATMRPVDLTVTDFGIVIGTYEPAGRFATARCNRRGMAWSGRHASAGHHRGDDGEAHGGRPVSSRRPRSPGRGHASMPL